MFRIMKGIYYRNPVRRNLMILFVSLFITTALPSIVVISRFSVRTALEEKQRAAIGALETAGQRLEQKIEGASNVSTAILSNSSMHSMLKRGGAVQTSFEVNALESNLYTICSTSTDGLSAYIYDMEQSCYYSDSARTKVMKYPDFGQYLWYDALLERDGGNLLLYTNDIYEGRSEYGSLSVVRIINHLDTLEQIGYMVLNISRGGLEGCFSVSSDQMSSYVVFRDDKEILTVMSGSPAVSDVDIYKEVDGYEGVKGAVSRDGYILCAAESGGLTLMSFTPVEVEREGIQQYFKYILSILLVNIAIMLAGLFILSRSITKPLGYLAEQMNRLVRKDFGTIDSRYEEPNEIGLLTRHYNQMAGEIESLIQKEIVIQKTKRNLELNLMQAQFKPHFLYNTIDTARSLCLQGQNEAANSLLRAMGGYYQNILSRGKNIISIEAEVDTIRQYEKILEYKDDFETEIIYEIAAETRLLPVLKFILQPLVENALKHGFGQWESGTVWIRCCLESGGLVLEVEDDGAGIKAETARGICTGAMKNEGDSFGLRATVERMKLFYGEQLHIEITGKEMEGTLIRFRIDEYESFIPDNWGDIV